MKRFCTLESFAIGLFIVLWGLLLPLRMGVPPSLTFDHDAAQYSDVAVNLVQQGFYSLDGVTPYFAREPGMSVWLAGIYAVFGIENRLMVFILQGALFLGAAWIFTREFARHAGKRAADISLLLLFITAPVYHAVFSLYRESLAFSVGLLFFAALLYLVRTRALLAAMFAGITLGYLTLTYTTFLLFPVVLLPLMFFLRTGWKQMAVLMAFFALTLAPWGIRNTLHTGSPCLTGCGRSAIQLYVRGVQTRDLHRLEPFYCLYSEYVSRNWEGRSPSCSFNAVMHHKWPNGFQGTPEDALAGEEGKQLILADIPNYLWLAIVEVVELHLPYVNGWGTVYNWSALISMIVLYIGILLAIPLFRHREPYMLLIGMLMLYHTGIFALTDATPRYLLPAIFCYSALAGVGYARLTGSLTRWNA